MGFFAPPPPGSAGIGFLAAAAGCVGSRTSGVVASLASSVIISFASCVSIWGGNGCGAGAVFLPSTGSGGMGLPRFLPAGSGGIFAFGGMPHGLAVRRGPVRQMSVVSVYQQTFVFNRVASSLVGSSKAKRRIEM